MARKWLLSWFRRSEILTGSSRNELSTCLLETFVDDVSGLETRDSLLWDFGFRKYDFILLFI